MSTLFIELYLDEDVDVLVAELLRARGYTVITTREAGQLGQSDVAQLVYATAGHKAFLTHNRIDFEALAEDYFTGGQTHYGIIIAVRRSPHELVRRLMLVLDQVAADEMQNQLLYI